MQTTASFVPQYCFWLMIASIATAVLPVFRSPMISSRCPRPIGIIASIALMPVCIGSCTGWRSAMPGAMMSTFSLSAGSRRAVDRTTQRVDHAAQHRLADRHLEQTPGALDEVALFHAR
jgi:hypothetical protein